MRSSGKALWVSLVLVALAAMAGLLIAILQPDEQLPTDTGLPVIDDGSKSGAALGQEEEGLGQSCATTAPDTSPTSTTESQLRSVSSTATAHHRNTEGGYSFWFSPDWKLKKRGSLSKLIGPGRDFVVSFSPGPDGGLPVAYDQFYDLVNEAYGDVNVADIKGDHVGGNLSVRVRGDGINESGTRFRFLAVLIERSGQGAVGAFGAWDPEARVSSSVRDVLESFRATCTLGS